MNLSSVNLYQLSVKELVRINARLPKPKQHILGDTRILPVTVAMGCQITLAVDDLRLWLMSPSDTCFLLDGNKKISFPCQSHNTSDTTLDFLHYGGYYCLGSASLEGRYDNHVDVLYSPQFFGFDKNNMLEVPLQGRHGWCCTMTKKKLLRDAVVSRLQSHHMDKFEDDTWFCYDGIDVDDKEMVDRMFRKPYSGEGFFIEHVDGYDSKGTDSWRRLRFINKHEKKMFESDKNIHGDQIGFMLGPWHKQSLIELVTEATQDYFEPTEKIIKPIRAGMPFVVVGSRKFLYRLKKMGFKTFYPFIDESYDEEPNNKKRIMMAVDAMMRFVENPKNLADIEDICTHNQNVLIKIGKHDPIRRTAKKLRHLISFT